MSVGAASLSEPRCALAAGALPRERRQVAPVEVSISRTEVSTRLGESFGFSSEITNTGTETAVRARRAPERRRTEQRHLRRSRGLVGGADEVPAAARLPASRRPRVEGQGRHRRAGRDLRRRAAEAAATPAVSPAMDVRIADTKDLNSGGVLPLALGVPALLGAVRSTLRRRRR